MNPTCQRQEGGLERFDSTGLAGAVPATKNPFQILMNKRLYPRVPKKTGFGQLSRCVPKSTVSPPKLLRKQQFEILEKQNIKIALKIKYDYSKDLFHLSPAAVLMCLTQF
jgi:hypothetical protein